MNAALAIRAVHRDTDRWGLDDGLVECRQLADPCLGVPAVL